MTDEPCWCGAALGPKGEHLVLSTEQNSLSGSYLAKDSDGTIIHHKESGRG